MLTLNSQRIWWLDRYIHGRLKKATYILGICGLQIQCASADWSAWHLPGGPVGPPVRWATALNVEVGQTTCPVNGNGRKGGGNGTGEGAQGPLVHEGSSLWISV